MSLSTKHINRLKKNKALLVTSIVILLCLALSIFFPVQNTFQSISRSIFFLIVLPVLYIKLILKENLSDWGWNLENKKIGLIWSAAALLLALAVFYSLIRFAGFSVNYKVSPIAANNFIFFLLYELIFLNIFFFLQEFFFKSFVLFSFRKFGAWAVFIQTGLYLLSLILTGKFSWQTLPFMFISFFGGIVVYKTRSFFYSYFFGLSFIILLDAFIIHLIK